MVDGPFFSTLTFLGGFLASLLALNFLKNSNGDDDFFIVVLRDLCCRALGARDPVLAILDWNNSLTRSLLLAET